jgi:hypothetical protein
MVNSKIFEPYTDEKYEALVFDKNGQCTDYYDPISSISVNDVCVIIDNTYHDYEIELTRVGKIYVRPYDNTIYGWGTLTGNEMLIFGV